MAVAFDAVGPSASGTANTTGTSMTWAHTCGASANLLLVGAVLGAETPGSEGTFSGATYNGVAMTSLGLVHSNNSNAGFVHVFYLLNPPTGSAFNVVVTRTGGGGTQDLIGGSMSYSGAGTPTFTTAFGFSTAPAITVSSAVGDRVAAFATSGSTIASTNQTQRILDNAGTPSGAGNFLFSDAAGAASVTTTDTATSDWWGVVGVQIPAGVTGPVPGERVWAHWKLTPPGIKSPGSGRFLPGLRGPAPEVISKLDLRTNNADSATYDSNTFTPSPGKLLFVMAHGTASVATDTTLTASANGITFTPVADMVQVLSGHTTAWFVADQLTPASPVPMTVTWDCTSDPSTGAFLAVAEVDEITRTGLAAIKQTALNANIAANGPYTATFSTAVTPSNPVLGMVAYVGGLSITEPPQWFEIDEPPDMTLPAQGFEWAKRDYGETGTAMAWTASAATNRANVGAVEFDMSPVSGLTSVTSTRATSWDTLAPVTSSRATTWTTQASVTSTRATTWNTLASVAASIRATTWNTLASVSSTRATTWNTRAAVTSTRATTWNTLASVVSTRATTWNTAASVASTRATTWNTLESVSSTRATTWNVLTSLTSVTSTRATTWNTLASVLSTRATTWNTAASVSSTRATTWNTLASVLSTRATTWNTRAAVLSTRATTWNTAASVLSTRATTWNTRAAVTSSRTTTWNTLASVLSTRATTWNVAANLVSVTSTRATTWNVVGQVTSTRATTWTTRAAITSTRATSWSVLTPATSSRATTWATLSLVTSARATTWRTLAAVLSTRATTWNVFSSVIPDVPVANPRLNLAHPSWSLYLSPTTAGILLLDERTGALHLVLPSVVLESDELLANLNLTGA